ncbi:uncharacterized protein [Lolium perenne]|uniref:uncharacterized protein n=1 Tax=Lolium perenne TaxID=4522 RepID=UPI003A9A6221
MSGSGAHTGNTPPPAQGTAASQTARQSVTPAPEQRRCSPSRRRSRVRRGGGEIVVHREVVREGGSGSATSLVFPMLKRGEYTNWALVMEVNLQAASLWDAIEDDDVSRREDKQALAALLRSTPPEMHAMLIGKGSAMAAWQAIKLQHQGNDRVRDTRVRRLRTEFETITFREGERVDEFSLRITTLAATLRSLGDTCDDERIVRKFLSVVHRRLVQIAFSIETMMDPSVLTVEEVVGHLQDVEERLDGEKSDTGRQLLLTEKQWEEKRKQGRGGSGGSSSHGGGGSSSGNRSGGRYKSKAPAANAGDNNVDRDKCRYCKKKGHWERDCHKKQRDHAASATANLVEQEEEGEEVHMATVVELEGEADGPSLLDVPAAAMPASTAPLAGEQVYLNEERASVVLKRTPQDLDAAWYLDTGASNHMTGDDAVFAELDRTVTGKVRFGDGSVVEICGRGTVLFAIDDGRHRELARVYWIPRLKTNIVSIGQLDEIGFPTHVEHGFMTVRDADKVLVAKVPRTKNRLYIVHLQIVQPVCLAAHANDDAWRWHSRFAHQSFTNLEKMAKQGMHLLALSLDLWFALAPGTCIRHRDTSSPAELRRPNNGGATLKRFPAMP